MALRRRWPRVRRRVGRCEYGWHTSAAESRRVDFGSRTQSERPEAANQSATRSRNHPQVPARPAKRPPRTDPCAPLPRVWVVEWRPPPKRFRRHPPSAHQLLPPFEPAAISHERPPDSVDHRQHIFLVVRQSLVDQLALLTRRSRPGVLVSVRSPSAPICDRIGVSTSSASGDGGV
jgi:hypothetical protein